MSNTHVVSIAAFRVDALGNIIDNNSSSVWQQLYSRLEHRIVADQAVPNSLGNPSIKQYLEAEAADDFILSNMSSGMIVTSVAVSAVLPTEVAFGASSANPTTDPIIQTMPSVGNDGDTVLVFGDVIDEFAINESSGIWGNAQNRRLAVFYNVPSNFDVPYYAYVAVQARGGYAHYIRMTKGTVAWVSRTLSSYTSQIVASDIPGDPPDAESTTVVFAMRAAAASWSFGNFINQPHSPLKQALMGQAKIDLPPYSGTSFVTNLSGFKNIYNIKLTS